MEKILWQGLSYPGLHGRPRERPPCPRVFPRRPPRPVTAVPPGNAPAFKALWASLSTQFNSLTNRALEIERLAEDLQGSLVRELVQASKETAALQDQ